MDLLPRDIYNKRLLERKRVKERKLPTINFILFTGDSQELYKWVFEVLNKLLVNTAVK